MNPNDFDPGPLAHAEHHKDGERSTLVFVRYINHPPHRVWRSLTDPEELRQWAPFDPDRSLDRPGDATLRMTDGGTTEAHPATVRHAVTNELLEYTWGPDLLRWELAPEGSGTRLTLRHTVDHPDWLSRTAAGWHLCLVVAERLLDGRPVGRIVGSDAKNYGWEALQEAYAAKLGVPSAGWPQPAH